MALLQQKSMGMKTKRQSWVEYLNEAAILMDDPKKIEFARYFIRNRLNVVADDKSHKIPIGKLSENILVFFVYSVILEWEERCKDSIDIHSEQKNSIGNSGTE